jgi:hypothetical protein
MITLKLQRFGGYGVACAAGDLWTLEASARPDRQADDEGGYALADALVAMLILTVVLIMSLRGLGQARDAGDLAWEARRANSLLAHLIEDAPHRYEVSTGTTDGFSWQVETTGTGAERPIEVCRRAVTLASRTGRTYRAATLEACPQEPAA